MNDRVMFLEGDCYNCLLEQYSNFENLMSDLDIHIREIQNLSFTIRSVVQEKQKVRYK
jgi:hypothetical protein